MGPGYKDEVSRATAQTPAPSDGSPARSGSGEGGDAKTRRKATILVVEDEPLLRKLSVRILTSQGYEVLSASEGNMALELEASFEGTLDLLLTDVVMPGLSGRDVADAIRQKRPGIAVLFMSGFPNGVLDASGVSPAESSFLRKPFSVPELIAKVREALASSPRATSSATPRPTG